MHADPHTYPHFNNPVKAHKRLHFNQRISRAQIHATFGVKFLKEINHEARYTWSFQRVRPYIRLMDTRITYVHWVYVGAGGKGKNADGARHEGSIQSHDATRPELAAWYSSFSKTELLHVFYFTKNTSFAPFLFLSSKCLSWSYVAVVFCVESLANTNKAFLIICMYCIAG